MVVQGMVAALPQQFAGMSLLSGASDSSAQCCIVADGGCIAAIHTACMPGVPKSRPSATIPYLKASKTVVRIALVIRNAMNRVNDLLFQ